MRLDAYDKKYRTLKQKSKYYREKEEKQKFVYTNNPLYELIYERDNK